MTKTLHLREVKTVMDETGMSRERVLELRAMPRPEGNVSYRLVDEWSAANALRPEVSLEFCQRILDQLGPASSRRIHDTSTGPIAGITGGPHFDTIRTGQGACQRCEADGTLRLVGNRWLCEQHARRQESRDGFRAMVKAA